MPRPPKYTAAAADHLAPAPRNLFVGTSGWAYPSWKPGFYPSEVPSRAFLHFYASQLTAVEVNYSFRALPKPEQLAGWLAATPPGFQFSFKAPQRITHFQRLLRCAGLVEDFVTALRPALVAGKLGPLLFQLPPNFQLDLPRLNLFLQTPALRAPGIRVAFEFRHPSWFTQATYDALHAAEAAMCIADTDDLTTPEIVTTDFHCFRLRRDGGYSATELDSYARRFTTLASNGPTFVFLRHQDEPTGALNAATLLENAARLPGVLK